MMRRKARPKRQNITIHVDKDVRRFLREVGARAGVDASTVANVLLCMYVVRIKHETEAKK